MKIEMQFKSITTILVGVFLWCHGASAQAIYEDERYVPETDSLTNVKLSEWQDLKFGLLMHWGPYSQWGVVESWSICPEDYGWCERKKGSNPQDYFSYKKEYEDLKKTFNPVKFNPGKWAKAARDAGMKYVVFTTKHHDGFSMFDSKYTDYKVTDPETPFSSNPKANITKEIFDAFRGEGLWAGAYFSKPDWHHENYWSPNFPPFDRNANYDPALYPEQWEKYVQFTHNQILELLTDYGKVDILWLDGGWVKNRDKENIEQNYAEKFRENASGNGFLKHRVVSQDIRMDELVEKAREKQPGLIVVDRAVHGKNQNYLTPENRIPEKPLPYPWESCIIAGGGWSYSFDANYMSGREAIHTLVDIVAKGGNLLLNIAPSPEGEWDAGAYGLLEEIGDWMNINDEAIYGTKSMAPYKSGNVCVTTKSDGSIYLIYLVGKEQKSLPSTIEFPIVIPKKAKATILGMKPSLQWKKQKEGISINLPLSLRSKLLGTSAFVIKIK